MRHTAVLLSGCGKVIYDSKFLSLLPANALSCIHSDIPYSGVVPEIFISTQPRFNITGCYFFNCPPSMMPG